MTTFSQFYVLDAFALLAFFQSEPGEPRVRAVLTAAEIGKTSLKMTVVNAAEVVYRTARRFNLDRARVVEMELQALSIEFVAIDQSLAMAAARIKAVQPISFADCLAVALASQLNGTILTGDPDFRRFEREIALEWLPIP